MATRRHRPPLGQHFLADRTAVARIVAASALSPGDPVYEIGPGRGALTGALIEAAGRIAAIELDPALARRLRERFPPERLALLTGSVLECSLADVAAALGPPEPARLWIAGNLPYAVSKPVVQLLVRERERVAGAVLMFQREVAARLTATPDSPGWGPLAMLAQEAFAIERLFDLAPRAFRPPPAVHSTVTRWRPHPEPRLAPADEPRLRAVLAAIFMHRRRTLRNNLRAALNADDARVDALLARCDLDGSLRAEQLPRAAILRLAAAWPLV